MKALRFVPFLALGLTACPGDDGGAEGTATATDSTTEDTTAGPTTEPSTSATTMPSTSGEPTTDTTGGPGGTDTGDPDSGSTGTTGSGLECPYTPVDGMPSVMLEVRAEGFDEALLAVGDPVDKDVLYVLQKGGEIKRLEAADTMAPAENWLDLPVYTSSESGLLGLAFHPDYETNNLIYVAHSPVQGVLTVTEFPVEGGVPNTGAGRDVIGVGQPEPNHNGGMVQFGPDGMLYLSVGDGGAQNDACGHGQNGNVLLGKILRIDPAMDGTADMTPGCPAGGGMSFCNCNGAGPFDYTIPADNPFVGDDSVRDEIYAVGFRNPWRMSFDPIDGRLWVGDVGQSGWEEVSVIESGDNAGWGDMEGNHCFDDPGCDEAGLTGMLNADGLRQPVAEYENGPGNRCSMIGLGNYRSCEVPAWDGLYFYGDACSGEVYAVSFDGTTVTPLGVVASVPDAIYGGGYNAYGDVFVASASNFGAGQPVYRIAPAR